MVKIGKPVAILAASCHPVSCVLIVACVSGLSILNCSFGFLLHLFAVLWETGTAYPWRAHGYPCFFGVVHVAHVLAICIVLFLVCALCAQCPCGLWFNIVCVLWPNVATVTGLAIPNCSSNVLRCLFSIMFSFSGGHRGKNTEKKTTQHNMCWTPLCINKHKSRK